MKLKRPSSALSLPDPALFNKVKIEDGFFVNLKSPAFVLFRDYSSDFQGENERKKTQHVCVCVCVSVSVLRIIAV